MWDRLRGLLSGDQNQDSDDTDHDERVRASAAILMVQAALADGAFCDDERAKISAALTELFELDPAELSDLLDAAEQKAQEAVDLFAQTRLLTRSLSEEERLKILEILWRVVDADGAVHDYEAALIRRVTGLLGLDDRDAALARRHARAR